MKTCSDHYEHPWRRRVTIDREVYETLTEQAAACEPQEHHGATCPRCRSQVRGLLDSGICGWCATERHPDRLSWRMELHGRGEFTPPPDPHRGRK